MDQNQVMQIGADAIIVAMKVASPALVTILVVGMLISVLQAATQINEQTLTFIPKIIFMSLALMVTGPWIMQTFLFFTQTLFKSMATITR